MTTLKCISKIVGGFLCICLFLLWETISQIALGFVLLGIAFIALVVYSGTELYYTCFPPKIINITEFAGIIRPSPFICTYHIDMCGMEAFFINCIRYTKQVYCQSVYLIYTTIRMIQKLSLDHADTIASMLSAHFHSLNEELGKTYYKEDEATMKKQVHERLATKGPIMYVGVFVKDELVGFVNYLNNVKTRKIEIWSVVGEKMKTAHITELLEYCHNLVKEYDYKSISIDIADHEKTLKKAFEALGGWKKTNYYVM